jgi:hypothetical protein
VFDSNLSIYYYCKLVMQTVLNDNLWLTPMRSVLISTLRLTSSWLLCALQLRLLLLLPGGIANNLGFIVGAKLTAQRATPDMATQSYPSQNWTLAVCTVGNPATSHANPLNVCLHDMRRNGRAQTAADKAQCTTATLQNMDQTGWCH